MEKQIAEETQKKIKAKRAWNSMTFSGLMKYDPLEAARFAVDCGINTEMYGVPVKEYIAKREAELENSKPTIDANIEADDAEKQAKADAKAEESQLQRLKQKKLFWLQYESQQKMRTNYL